MKQRPTFVEKIFPNPTESGTEHLSLYGPSTAAIGWIPYYGIGDAFTKSDWRTAFHNERPIRMLFATGNPEPQPEFSGPVRFADRLDLGDFRAAVAIRTPVLGLDVRRRPVSFRFGQFLRVGRTPIPFMRESLQIQLPGRGADDQRFGRVTPRVRFSHHAVVLHLEYLFKLGKLADLAGAVLTGKFAPFAWIRLKYRIDTDGHCRLEIQHSVVPSVRWYIERMDSNGDTGDWEAFESNLMEQRPFQEFREFVDTESSERGPNGGIQSFDARCYPRRVARDRTGLEFE